ncbi:carbon monoxide dehydrogenase [Humibacillus sp. DSM 29435]|uniref:SRPBCC family protein n=1 Tax=Humibacillus sp. DSM 29435 TaxID=1869167 RepID=UPI000871E124|nr:carbon monoxide dehydrogenase subunit G [Humibacillus sp. DSM 29435]OFE14793.1 carbon monoxide dehydrogenase [Humibacillus sp. DSM 29435]
MKITGTATLTSDPGQVWDAFHDPAVLARCLPGCEQLSEVSPDHYAMTVTAGVAAIKGTYDGEVALREPRRPDSFTLKASGSGAPGTVDASVVVRLTPATNGGTDLVYDADASVGGAIGGVGQRMLSGVTRKLAGQFFSAVDADLTGERAAEVVVNPTDEGQAAGVAGGEPAPLGAADAAAGRSAASPTVASDSRAALDFALGVAAGAAVALLGVALGWRLRGRG